MEVEAEFPPELVSAAEARHLAEHTLAAWECHAQIESARLLVSELVVNAVLHARSAALLRLKRGDGVVRIEVGDTSTALPERRAVHPHATTGRGLLILDALADTWGVDVHTGGKIVWFELNAPGLASPVR